MAALFFVLAPNLAKAFAGDWRANCPLQEIARANGVAARPQVGPARMYGGADFI
jgi:hypothetical protein